MKRTLVGIAIGLLVGQGSSLAIANDTLKKISDTGAITLGVRDASGGLSYTLGEGKYAGFHVELCQRIVQTIEKAMKRQVSIRYQTVTSQNRVPLVQNGTVDLECGSTTNNLARQRDVAFAVTTFVEEVRLATKTNSGITSISQLNGKNVATTTGTTSVQHLRKHERANGVDFKEIYGKDHADSFLLLESGRAEAFVMDSSILAGNIANAKNPADYQIVGEVLSIEPIAIMMRKDDVELKKIADDTIKGLAKSGELAKIYERWFMKPIPPKNVRIGLPASDNTKAAWAHPNDKPMEDYAKR